MKENETTINKEQETKSVENSNVLEAKADKTNSSFYLDLETNIPVELVFAIWITAAMGKFVYKRILKAVKNRSK